MNAGTALLAALGVALGLTALSAPGAETLDAGDHPGAPTVSHQGKLYKVIRGAAYEVRGRDLIFVQQIYAPDFHAKNYRREGKTVYRVLDGTQRYPVLTSIDEGFEGAVTIRDLVGPIRPWQSITLQSPRAPTVASYVRLRQRVLRGAGEYLDNRLEPSSARSHGGTQALRALAMSPKGGAFVSKASLECELAYFVKGDDFWFSGWFYIAQGRPLGLLDLETSHMTEYPGLRVLLDENHHPRVELKWADKPTYTATAGAALPAGRWVHLRLHALLSDGADGRVEMWVDGRRVIDARGQTLPLPDTVYDRIEIGITANTGSTAEVFVDDVKVGKRAVD